MSDSKHKNRIWIDPRMDCNCGCVEGEKDIYHLAYDLPGVNREDINLKVSKGALRLLVKKDDLEYVNEFTFSCEADADGVKAVYENGTLELEIPLACTNPFRDARTIKIG